MRGVRHVKLPHRSFSLLIFIHHIGGSLIEDYGIDTWPQLLVFVAQKCQSSNPVDREVGLTLLKPLAGYLAASSSDKNDNGVKNLLDICHSCLLDFSLDGKLSILALSVASSVVAAVPSESEVVDIFSPLVLTIFRAFNNFYALFVQGNPSTNEAKLCVFLEILVEMAEEKPLLFCSQMGSLFNPIVALLSKSEGEAGSLPNSVKLLLVEFLVELAESCPKVIRKIRGSNREVIQPVQSVKLKLTS